MDPEKIPDSVWCEACQKLRTTDDWPLNCACGQVYLEGGILREGKWIPGNPCLHRGAAVRQMEGFCCNGREVVDVFVCEIHGECTIRNTRAGDSKPKPCLGCDDWAEPR